VPRPFFLVRHGQSDWNVLELTQGQSAHPRLTDLGRDQVRSAGALIESSLEDSDHGRVLVRTSDLTRAVESAEILVELLDGELRSDERLREQHLGELEGRSYAETWASAARHDWSDLDLPVAGGESPRQVRERMAEVLDEVDPDVVTVLVSHGDAIRAALAHLAGVPSDEAPWVEVPNGAVARVDGRRVSWLGGPTSGAARVRSVTTSTRSRRDRCPGVTRPWLAEDGALVRLRLVGGRITAEQLEALAAVSATYGDGNVHLTGRANVQVRALPHDGDRLLPEVHRAVLATGLVPSESHDLVRNVMVSPWTGRRGGRADLRPVADELDRLVRADARLAELPGRFLRAGRRSRRPS
jgi:probable phosphoglycerate mutase